MANAIGRPTKYNKISIGKFNKEKSIEEYIYANVEDIWLKVFNEKVIKVEKQKYIQTGIIELPTGQVLPKRGPRVDLYVRCNNKKEYLVEIKNPKLGSNGTLHAIGQILYYSTVFKEATNLVVISTLYEEGFLETIQMHNLPIDFMLFAKDEIYLLKK